MSELADHAPNMASPQSRLRLRLAVLLGFHIVVCCLSLFYVSGYYIELEIVNFDKARLHMAVLNVAPFAVVSALFAFRRFSFGYVLGFYFYTMILGYLWLATFSRFAYDHTSAGISLFISALAFLGPALFIVAPVKQRYIPSARTFDNLLTAILMLAAATVAAGAFYNFRLAGLANMYALRGDLEFPAWLRYAVGATSNALLPFAFACFVARDNRWRAAAALLLLVLFYPIMLTKLTLFAPLWLLFVALLSRFFEARTAALLSLFVPTSIGVALATLSKSGALPQWLINDYFGAVNFRMLAMPSVALDLYNDFFSTHSHTHFCQILILKPLISCPYQNQLSVVLEGVYHMGNFNASLFATEGVASVGALLAPLVVFFCGLVIGFGNRLAAGLPPRFVLVSGALFPHLLLNVALSTVLLTHGLILLFLLWYLTPRAMFQPVPPGDPPIAFDEIQNADNSPDQPIGSVDDSIRPNKVGDEQFGAAAPFGP
jgi:hypothetical protein